MKRLESLLWCGGAFLILYYAQDIGAGVAKGLHTCAQVLVPTLFPFLVFAHLLGRSRSGERFCEALSKVFYPVLGLPPALGSTFFMSLVGGYPVGARLLTLLVEEDRVDKKTAEKALCCCVNGGPSFLLSGVGMAMLGNVQAGLCLFLAQIASALTMCLVLFWADRGKGGSAIPSKRRQQGADVLFVESVRAGCSAMVDICLFVVVFSAVTSFLQGSGLLSMVGRGLNWLLPLFSEEMWKTVLTGLLEVTQGCMRAAAIGTEGLGLCAFFVSFSSLSIFFQVKATMPRGFPIKGFFVSRLFHGFLTTVYALLLWKNFFPQAVQTALLPHSALPKSEPNLLAASLLMMALCSMVVLWQPRDRKKFNISR